jgi:hypothetical protein
MRWVQCGATVPVEGNAGTEDKSQRTRYERGEGCQGGRGHCTGASEVAVITRQPCQSREHWHMMDYALESASRRSAVHRIVPKQSERQNSKKRGIHYTSTVRRQPTCTSRRSWRTKLRRCQPEGKKKTAWRGCTEYS